METSGPDQITLGRLNTEQELDGRAEYLAQCAERGGTTKVEKAEGAKDWGLGM